MSREMKYSGTDWIGEIPVQWELAPTKRVFRGKKRIVGDEADNYERLALTLNGVVKRTKDDNEGLQPEQFNNYQILEKNELVFKLIDLQNIRTSRVGLSPYTGIVSPAYIILSNSETDNRFYYYWFMDMYNRCIFNQMGDDGVRSALNIKDVLEIPLPLISESTRIKIASFLDRKCAEIDEMIALQEKIVEELKAYKQSVITEAVTKGLNPDAPMKDSGIEWIGEIPEHWEVHPFKAFYKTTKGLNITKDNLVESGIPVISYGQIHSKQNTGTSVSEELIRYVPADYIDSNPECLSKKYDIFFADTSEDREGAGNIALIDVEMPIFAGYHTIMAHPSDRVKSKYIAYLIKTDAWRCQLRCKVQGVKLFSISQKFVNQTSIIVPPISEQIQISEYLDTKCTEIDNLISIKLSKIDSLKEYKKSIIYEYVTGKKEVIL